MHEDEMGIRFRRTPETGELPFAPFPVLKLPPATNEELAGYFGLSGSDLMLVVAAVTFALAGRGTYPIVCIHGSHGSGKTVMLRRIMKLIDPQIDDKGRDISLRKLPKTEEDIYVAANSRFALAFDNVSGVSLEISDALCMIASGGASSTRKFYTNTDASTISAHAPIFLDGIEGLFVRQDFVSRSFVINLDPIAKEARKLESELDAEAEDLAPKVMARILELIVSGLARQGKAEYNRASRLADFEQWGAALEESAGWAQGSFAQALAVNQDEALVSFAEGNMLAVTIVKLMDSRSRNRIGIYLPQGWSEHGFEGSTQDLLVQINEHTSYPHSASRDRPKDWPKSPQALGNQLSNRLGEALEKLGIKVTRPQRGAKQRTIKLSKMSAMTSETKS
jgi:hypothetical protein